MTVLEYHADRFLRVLQANPGWRSRREIAVLVGQPRFYSYQTPSLEWLTLLGKIECRQTPATVLNARIMRSEYRAIDTKEG
jgi:hypothetical protein